MPLTVDEMYAYLLTMANGDETVPATFDDATGMWLPLMGADRDRMRSFRPIAEALAAGGERVHLVRFTTREDLGAIEAPEAPEKPVVDPDPEPAPAEAPPAYQSFSEPLAVHLSNSIVADGVIVAGSMGEDGQFELTIAYMFHDRWSPAVTVKGKVADDLMSLAEQAREAARRTKN